MIVKQWYPVLEQCAVQKTAAEITGYAEEIQRSCKCTGEQCVD